MLLTAELALILVLLLGLGVWGVVSGVRLARRDARLAATGAVLPQQLAALSQPYRALLGEALEVQREVARQARGAPGPLRGELTEIAARVERLVARALPRARHGTDLQGYLLRLGPDDPQRPNSEAAAARVEAELESLLATLRLIRGKVYQILTDATSLSRDAVLSRDLEDALLEVEALEQAFGEAGEELLADALPPVGDRGGG